MDRLIGEVWTSLQIDRDTKQEAPIPIDPANQALPVAGLAAAIAQMETALGRLGLTIEQDRTWKELLKKYLTKGMQIILQLLAQIQNSGVNLGTLCDAIKKNIGDLSAALDSISCGSTRIEFNAPPVSFPRGDKRSTASSMCESSLKVLACRSTTCEFGTR